jgi:hypothetical protein
VFRSHERDVQALGRLLLGVFTTTVISSGGRDIGVPHELCTTLDPSTGVDSPLYEEALSYAAGLHAAHLCKGIDDGPKIPYITHLLAVSALVWKANWLTDAHSRRGH